MKISPRERRLLSLLAAVAGIFVLRFVWSFATSGGEVGAAGPSRGAQARRAAARATLPQSIPVLALERLQADGQELTEVGRNPFRFGPPPTTPPPPGPTPEELERRRRELEERRRALAESAPPVPTGPTPPRFELRYLGSFGPKSRRIAVFADPAGTTIFNAREGDTLDEEFVVEQIGFESVDIGFVEFPDAPSVRLGIGQ